jgi:hypothetical protein
MTKTGINPKSLKGWCGQHPHERKILALLETDWPGTQEVSQKAMEYLKLHCSGSSNGGDDVLTNAGSVADFDVRITAHSLSQALRAYHDGLFKQSLADRSRLALFVDTLLQELSNEIPGETATGLRQQLLPERMLSVLDGNPKGQGQADAA